MSNSATSITVQEAQSNHSPRRKPPPRKTSIKVPFEYTPSDDGTDENMLILLHGLGDTHLPFARLARSLKLPQTATLAIRAPEQIPYLYEQAFQWYTSFDPLGELIERPNPTPALDLLSSTLHHLITDCSWPPERIHLFGFAQGGSVAVEFCLKWWKSELEKQRASISEATVEANDNSNDTAANQPHSPKSLGSAVTISGPLLSYYPALSHPCPTPLLIIHRPSPSESALPPSAITSFKKVYSKVQDLVIGKGEGMPRSREEWEPVMKLWSENLGRRQAEGLYQVLSGGPV